MDNIKERVTKYWAQRAKDFSNQRIREFESNKYELWMNEFNKYIPSNEKLEILDVGTGTGFFTFLLASNGHQVTGIDLTIDMIEEAKSTAVTLGIDADFLVMDAENLDFKDKKFDVIVSRNLTWTLPNLEKTYQAWYEVLKPNGIMINFDADYCHEKNDIKLPENHTHKLIAPTLMQEYENIKGIIGTTQQVRPLWDNKLLQQVGFSNIMIDHDVWQRIYNEIDEFYNPTPIFSIVAVKDPAILYQKSNVDYWTKRAASYSDVNKEELATSQNEVWTKTIESYLKQNFKNIPFQKLSVLDIGTGPGFFAILLAKLGLKVTAIDYTKSMLEEAKENAGALVNQIDFKIMNAELLEFEDNSFDVIISRNLTWNLYNPQKAYTSWNRVLKNGGLLLNFDANWYSYLYDEAARNAKKQDRENILLEGVNDETDGTDVDAMEAIAMQTPLSKEKRPEWDFNVLTNLGMNVETDLKIWQTVWTKEERVNNASTPMFSIYAVKP